MSLIIDLEMRKGLKQKAEGIEPGVWGMAKTVQCGRRTQGYCTQMKEQWQGHKAFRYRDCWKEIVESLS